MPAAPTAPVTPVPSAEPASTTALPALELPKGGGAIRGIGEKFAVNPATGTAR